MKASRSLFLLVFAVRPPGKSEPGARPATGRIGDGAGARALLAHAAQTRPGQYRRAYRIRGISRLPRRSGRYRSLQQAAGGAGRPAHRARTRRGGAPHGRTVLARRRPDGASRYLEIYQSAGGSRTLPAAGRGWLPRAHANTCRDTRTACARSAAWRPSRAMPSRRSAARPGAQCGHQWLPGGPQQRSPGTDRVPQTRASLSLAGARNRKAGRPGQGHQDRDLRFAERRRLLRILGFRMRGGCGSEVVLETVNATRAFLTTDSGFPLPALEQALRTNRPFIYERTIRAALVRVVRNTRGGPLPHPPRRRPVSASRGVGRRRSRSSQTGHFFW